MSASTCAAVYTAMSEARCAVQGIQVLYGDDERPAVAKTVPWARRRVLHRRQQHAILSRTMKALYAMKGAEGGPLPPRPPLPRKHMGSACRTHCAAPW